MPIELPPLNFAKKNNTQKHSGLNLIIVYFQFQLNGKQYQRIGDKVYSQDQLNILQKELQRSHFKPLNGSQKKDVNNVDINNKPLVNDIADASKDKSNVPDHISNNKLNNNFVNNGNLNNENPNKLAVPVPIGKDNTDAVPVKDNGLERLRKDMNKDTANGDTVQKISNMDNVNNNVIDTSVNRDPKKRSGVLDKVGGGGVFDVADLPRNDDLFDGKDNRVPGADAGGIPPHVKFINGEEEKNKRPEDIPAMGGGNEIVADNGRVAMQQPQEYVNNNLNNGVLDNAVPANREQEDEPDEKPGSLKVVWDWSDFAVNFEQYIMPEQKIRRAPHATTGEPWPMPQYYVTKKDKIYTIDRATLRFDMAKVRCEIIEKAVKRYKAYILEDAVEDMYDNFQHAQSTMFEDPVLKYDSAKYTDAPVITKVYIKIRKPCVKFPTAKSDESCKYTLSFSNLIS